MPNVSAMLDNLALIALDRGDTAQTVRLVEEALAIQRTIGFAWGEVDSLCILALVARDRGDVAQAARLFRDSLALAWELRDPQQLVAALDPLAILAAGEGQAEHVALLFSIAAQLYERIGLQPEPSRTEDRERAIAAVRRKLGPDAFAAAWAIGTSMPLEQAIAKALEDVPAEARVAGPAAHHGLTRRELDVLRLVVAGHSDRAIAEHLFVSRHTAGNHVASILAKLGVPSRAAAAAYAVRHGLA
jgi:DNA-binding CsgD family transcriptional regulator